MFKELALKYLHVTEPDEPPNEYQGAVLGFAGWLDNKHPELEQPDSEGWWWFMYPDGQLFCVDIFKEDGKLFREERDGHVYLATSYNGKWMRAIVPKGFESEGEDGKK